jgi:hypothetical protein
MTKHHGIVGGIALALSTLALVASTAGAATAPTFKVTPDKGLTNGQSVAVSGKGFPKSTTLYLVECLKTATTEAGCDISTATAVDISASGAIPKGTTFKVVSGKVTSTGKCGTTKGNAKGCAVVIGSISGTDYGAVVIDFKVG